MTPRPPRPPHAAPAVPQPVATTTILANAARTDPAAADAMAARVYARLRAIAKNITTGDRAGRDLGPEALIDAAYQKLYLDPIGPREVDRRRWQTGEQFWFEFVLTMKHILIDHARSMQRSKRSNGKPTLDLSLIDSDRMYDADPALILDTAAALDKLALRDPAAYEVAVLRHYGRMSTPEIAAALDRTAWKVEGRWQMARAFLRRELKARRPAGEPETPHD